jgi:hypothetical protein
MRLFAAVVAALLLAPECLPPAFGQMNTIPWPRRKKKNPEGDVLKTLAGKFQSAGEKSLTVDADDGRVVELRLTEKLKVIEDAKEIRLASLRRGDVVSIDYTEDDQGFFYAREIRVTGHAPAPKPAEKPAEPRPPAEPEATASATATLPPVAGDQDDDDTPRLRRGVPPKRKHTAEAEATPAAPATPAEAPAPISFDTGSREKEGRSADGTIAWPSDTEEDPIITKARTAASGFSEKLPNYVTTEMMTRYQGEGHPIQWRALDIVSMEVVYQDGKEDYQKLAVNGKPAKAKDLKDVGGAWSSGEFGSWLLDIFSPATNAQFLHRGQETIARVRTHIFDFRVDKPNSHWKVQLAAQWITPAYKGSLWIDPRSGRVLRIEVQAVGLPDDFPIEQAESSIDYEYVRLGTTAEYLLPVHAASLACQRFARGCSRLDINFRNYHRFGSDSAISYDEKAK